MDAYELCKFAWVNVAQAMFITAIVIGVILLCCWVCDKWG